jgi:hypothetical protein
MEDLSANPVAENFSSASRVISNHGWTQRGTAATEVAQNFILPYRGFVIRWAQPNRTHPEDTTFRRMQFGDTADYKSALRQSAPRAKNLRRKTKLSQMALRIQRACPVFW